MATLPWSQEIIDWFLSNRTDLFTDIFVFFTILGNEQGYILIVAGFYWLYDDKLAIKLAIVIIISSLFNHILKILIRNPRPFVTEETYQENWAIPEGDIEDTADSFSTPSGHAMGAASFWTYLHLKLQSRFTFVLFPIMIFMIGISRPYLGVHFLEDVILGWIFGILVVWLVMRYEAQVEGWWNNLGDSIKLVLMFVVPILVFLIAGFISGFSADGEAFATYAGLYSGLIGGLFLESQYVGFEPRIPSQIQTLEKIRLAVLRYGMGVVLVFATLFGLDLVFAEIAEDESLLGFVLRYIRYTSVGLVAAFLVPFIFIRAGLAELRASD